MAEQLDVESLFATIGLQSILDARPTFHKYQIQRAANLPKDIRRRVLRFLATDAVAEAKDVPEFDYDKALELIPAGPKPEQTAALIAMLGDELGTDLGIQANRILTWANGILPREARLLPGGQVRQGEPGPNATADFRRQWQVAADPTIVLDDLEDGSLADDQVATLALLYPAIYAEMRQAVTDGMAAMTARRGENWEPGPTKGGLLSTLLQESATDPDLTIAIQQLYDQQAQAAAPTPARAARRTKGNATDAAATLTPGQKAEGAATS